MKDPRTYIKPVPIPTPPSTGLKIQARSEQVFNPTLPTRDDVRKEHYQRRLVQMSQQGFRSLIHKPYQGIGDPFYLDHKKLILHALGQWEEGQELETSSSSESEDDFNDPDSHGRVSKSNPAANFVLRRTRKDLNTLPNEISHARNRIRNVRLGHGLFQLVRREREDKATAKLRAENSKRQALLNEWQAPNLDSSDEDETDDELAQDVDLRNFLVTYQEFPREHEAEASPVDTMTSLQPPLSEVISDTNRSKVAFHGVEQASVCSKRTRSAHSRSSGSRRKLPNPRPYTPQHSNIASEQFSWPDKLALFRQLSALYWLLEAMNLDSSMAMGPIMTCWHLNEIGGCKMPQGKLQDMRKSESKWKQFIANPNVRDGSPTADPKRRIKRGSSFALHRADSHLLAQGSKRHLGGRLTARAHPRKYSSGKAVVSPASSVSQLNHQANQATSSGRLDDVPEDSVMSQQDTGNMTDHEDDDKPGTFVLLEDYDAVSRDREEHSQPDGSSLLSDMSGFCPPNLRGRSRRRNSEHDKDGRKSSPSPPKIRANEEDFITDLLALQKHLESINRSDEDPRLHALANPREKMSSKEFRADINVRPRSTPAVIEYKNKLPSNSKGRMAQEMRQRFAEITEEKALMMHDALEAKERKRLRVLQNKFVHMPTGGSSFHRGLIEMRRNCVRDEERRDKQRRSSVTHLPWFMELINNIPDDIKRDWYFQKILDQLSRYGRIDSSKQSAYKFLKVLSALRAWEVCSPDISAAIEFCREKIVDMAIEEFEEWFRQQFPTVCRPHTAPPSGSDENAKTKPKMKAPKSAPPTGRSENINLRVESPLD